MAAEAAPAAEATPFSMCKALDTKGLSVYLDEQRPPVALALVGTSKAHAVVARTMLQMRNTLPDLHLSLRCLAREEDLVKKKERPQSSGSPALAAPAHRGVLKSGWCAKHRDEVFGCVLALVDVDAYQTKEAFEAACEATVDKLKAQLRGRHTKILLVVATRSRPLPFYETPEKAQSELRKKCQLESARHVAAFHLEVGVVDGITRVARNAQELALQYYKDECKRIKRVRDNSGSSSTRLATCSAPNPRLLQARHQFKIGYFYEVRGKASDAAQHYRDCYEICRRCAPAAVAASAPSASQPGGAGSGTAGGGSFSSSTSGARAGYSSALSMTQGPAAGRSLAAAPSSTRLSVPNSSTSGTSSGVASLTSLPLSELRAVSEVVMFRLAFVSLLSGAGVVSGGSGSSSREHSADEQSAKVVKAMQDHLSWYRSVGGVAAAAGAAGASTHRDDQSRQSTGSSGGGFGGGVFGGGGGSATRGSAAGSPASLVAPGWGTPAPRAAAGGAVQRVSSEGSAMAEACPFIAYSHYVGVARQLEKFANILTRMERTPRVPPRTTAGSPGSPGPGGGGSEGERAATPARNYCAQYSAAFHLQSAAAAAQSMKSYCVQAFGPDAQSASAPSPTRGDEPAFVGQPWFGGSEFKTLQHLIAAYKVQDGLPSLLEEVLRICRLAQAALSNGPGAIASARAVRAQRTLSLLAARTLVDLNRHEEARAEISPVAEAFSRVPWPMVSEAVFKVQLACGLRLRDAPFFLRGFLDYACHAVDRPDAEVSEMPVQGVATCRQLYDHVIGRLHAGTPPAEERDPEDTVLDLLASAKQPIALPVAPLHPFLSMLVHFAQPVVYVTDNECAVNVRLSTHCPFVVPVTAVALTFETPGVEELVHTLTEDERGPSGGVVRDRPVTLRLRVTFKEAGLLKLRAVSAAVGGLRLLRSVGPCEDLVAELGQLASKMHAGGEQGAAAGGAGGVPPLAQVWGEQISSPLVTGSYATTAKFGVHSSRALAGGYGDNATHAYGSVSSEFLDRPVLRVLEPQPTLAVGIHHQAPALVSEAYPVTLRVDPGSAGAQDGYITLPENSYYEVLAAYEGEVLKGGHAGHVAKGRPAVERRASADGTGTELVIGRNLGADETWVCTVVLSYTQAGEHPLPVTVHYATEMAKQVAVTQPCELRVVIPYDLHVSAADSLAWTCTDSNTEHLVQSPYRTCAHLVRTNIPQTDADSPRQRAWSQSQSPGRPEAAAAVPASIPYTSTMFVVSEASMRRDQDFFLTVTATNTVDQYPIEFIGVQVDFPSKEVTVVKSPPALDGAVLSQGEEVSFTWVLRAHPTGTKTGVKGGALLFARRVSVDGGEEEPGICFSSELPYIPITTPVLVPSFGFPSHGRLGEMLTLRVTLLNTSATEAKRVVCEAKDVEGVMIDKKFLWSGRSLLKADVLPGSSATLLYNLIPVYPGTITLPTFAVQVDGESEELVLAPSEVASVFISPSNSAFRVSKNYSPV